MIRHYCTLFDKNYLNKGLALHLSLKKHATEPFVHHILCMDDVTHSVLSRLNLPQASLIKIEDFEDDEMKAVKASRSIKEYYWSLSPNLPSYILKHHPELDMVTYLDSDLFFFSSPDPIFQAFNGFSTLIIPHNLPPEKKAKEQDVGKYNVGMLIFRNDTDGRACLSWWRERCNEWCFERIEPNRFGDQKYLDYFVEKFHNVLVYDHPGADLAPWNIKNYKNKINAKNQTVMVNGMPLIFFHFSGFQLYSTISYWLPEGVTNSYHYFRPSINKDLIYKPYIKAIREAIKQIHSILPDFSDGTVPRPGIVEQLRSVPRGYIKDTLHSLRRKLSLL